MVSNSPVLVIDLGGTFVRLASYQSTSEPVLQQVLKYNVADLLSLSHAIELYLSQNPAKHEMASISVAGPAEDNRVELVNHSWQFSLQDIKSQFHFKRVCAINDFKSIAFALPFIPMDQQEVWQTGRVISQAAKIVLGPGTGLGLGVCQFERGKHLAFATEGGNIAFAPQSALQDDLFKWARVHLPGRVYVEQFVSGPGLCNLANALAAIEDEPLPDQYSGAQWVEKMLQADSFALRVLDLFAELFGSYCGDMVLAHGARAGAYLAGGVMSRLQDVFPREVFLAAFADKGRYASYLEQVPVYLCQHPEPGLLGAGAYAEQEQGESHAA